MLKEAEIQSIEDGYEITIGDGETADFKLYVKKVNLITSDAEIIPIEELMKGYYNSTKIESNFL
jgi:hypothetical protein